MKCERAYSKVSKNASKLKIYFLSQGKSLILENEVLVSKKQTFYLMHLKNKK